MKIIVIGFVGIVDGSLAIGGIAIGDYSKGPKEVVVVAVVVVVVVVVVIVVVVVVVFAVIVVVVVVVVVMKVKINNFTYSSVS
jgi:hypothetical protein